MTSHYESIPVAESGGLRPVRPTAFVRIVMRPLTKRLNPVLLRLAGRENFRMAAQVRHIGRRSGRTYTTPVSARISGNVAVIPLTFGNVSDWARNIQAAGGCEIRLQGRDYVARNPEFVTKAEIGPLYKTLFKRRERAMSALIGIGQFIRLEVAPF